MTSAQQQAPGTAKPYPGAAQNPAPASLLLRVDGPVMLFASMQSSEPALTAQGALSLYDVPAPQGSSTYKAQVGDVYWTLGPAVYCVRVNVTTFSFSVTESPGLYVTAVLPADTDAKYLEPLVAVLERVTSFHEPQGAAETRADPAAPDSLEAKAAQFAKTASYAIRTAAEATSHGLARSASLIRQTFPAATEHMQVSDNTLRNLEKAKEVAGSVASFTNRIASGLAQATCSFATRAADSVAHSGITEELTRKGVDVPTISRYVAAGLGVMREILVALELAGQQVLKAVASAATELVNHRYGPQAAAATECGIETAMHVTDARLNLMGLRPTALAKAAVKQTAKEAVATHAAEAAASTAAAAAAAETAATTGLPASAVAGARVMVVAPPSSNINDQTTQESMQQGRAYTAGMTATQQQQQPVAAVAAAGAAATAVPAVAASQPAGGATGQAAGSGGVGLYPAVPTW